MGPLFTQRPVGTLAAFCRTRLASAYRPALEGDRRGSNPRLPDYGSAAAPITTLMCLLVCVSSLLF